MHPNGSPETREAPFVLREKKSGLRNPGDKNPIAAGSIERRLWQAKNKFDLTKKRPGKGKP
jgi:hypothetical protein